MTLHADAMSVLSAWPAPDDEQERLRVLYLAHLAAHPDGLSRGCRPDHLTSSALVVDPSGPRVLLVLHRKAGLWLQTGGHVEDDDPTLAAAALREATEESGLAGLVVDPEPLLLSRHAVPFCGPVQPAHHLDVQFLAVAPPGAEPRVADGEDPVAWFGPDDVPEPTDDGLRALIAAAARRLPPGTPAP